MALIRAVISAGQNASILSALAAVFSELTLVFAALLSIEGDLEHRCSEHFCIQPSLVCDGGSIEAARQASELTLKVDQPGAGEALRRCIDPVIGQVSPVTTLIARVVHHHTLAAVDGEIAAQLSLVGAQLTFVLAELLPGLRALDLRLGNLAREVLIEGGVEPSEPRHVVHRGGGVVVVKQRSSARGVESIVGELTAVLPEVLSIAHPLVSVLQTLRTGERAGQQRSQHQVSGHAG